MKRLISIALCLVLMFSLCPYVFAEGSTITGTGATDGGDEPVGGVCRIGDTGYATLNAALATLADDTPTTIVLLKDVINGSGIFLSGKKVTIDLNGNNLSVNNGVGIGIEIEDGTELTLTGSGRLDVHAKFECLYLKQSSFIAPETVTVSFISDAWGLAADSFSTVDMHGDITGAVGGLAARYKNSITVNGTVKSKGENHAVYLFDSDNTVQVGSAIVDSESRTAVGVYVDEFAVSTVTVGSPDKRGQIIGKEYGLRVRCGALVTVYGDIVGDKWGLYTVQDSNVTVHGNVTSTGETGEGHGVYCFANSTPATININGDVEGKSGTYVHGAGSTLTINGNVTAHGEDPKSNYGIYASRAKVSVTGNLAASRCLGAHSYGLSEIQVDGTISAQDYIKVKFTGKTIADTDAESSREGYLQYSDGVDAFVWVKAGGVTAPSAPQGFTATAGNDEVALSWSAPASNGGSAITKYQVSSDNGESWTDVGLDTSHTFTGLTNGTEYTFKVRAVNSVGNGAEASVVATPTEYVCQIDAVKYSDLAQALEAAKNGQTIELLTNITHTSPIEIDGKTIYFELGDYNLLVDTSDYSDGSIYILTVENGGKLRLKGTGAGKFNLKSTSPSHSGIRILGAYAEAAVNSVDVTGKNATGVYMFGSDSALDGGKVTVNGPINAGYTGVSVNAKDGNIVINGDITAGHTGVQTATNPGTSVTVDGNITILGTTAQYLAGRGVYASGKTTVHVTGNVTGQGDDFTGVYAYGGTIEVQGNVVSSGVGAKAEPNYSYGNGAVTIHGSLSAGDKFIIVGSTEKAPEEKTEPTTKEGFLTYTDNKSTVWIGSVGTPPTYYSVTVENDGNGTASADLSFAVEGSEITLTATPGSGYQFKEWQVLSGGVTIVDNKFTMPSSNVTVKAIFEPIPAQSYTVSFYSESSLYAGKTVAGGSSLGTDWPANPTRSGYSFGGWFTGQNGAGEQYTSSTVINADVNLYAKWTYIDSGSGDSDTPAPPVYRAKLKVEGDAERAIAVTVSNGSGKVSIEEDPWNTRPGGSAVLTMPSISGIRTYSLGLAVSNLKRTDGRGTLTLKTDAGSITMPSNMLTGFATDGNKVQIAIGQGDKSNLPENVKNAIGNRPLIKLTMSIDGKQVNWSNKNAPVTVSVSYTPTAGELNNPVGIVVWYIDGDGNLLSIPNGRYDPETGTVSFTTSHLGYYAVGYNHRSFKDVPNDAWYAKAVFFIAAREITLGTGDDKYSPEETLTRGQFIVMLMRAYGLSPDPDFEDNFSDAGNTYYTGYLATAKRLGISAGVGDNLFGPERDITRQELLTLLYNMLKAISGLPQGESGKTLSDFGDAELVDTWAKEAVEYLVKIGIVRGDDGMLNPVNTITRAEMAQVLYNLLAR